MALTPKQQALLHFIRDYLGERGYAPTQWEIARRFRLKSLGSVQDYLRALEAQGYLTKSWNGRRAIQLTPLGSTVPQTGGPAAAVSLPLAGTVAAGKPVEAVEQQDTLEVPASLLKDGENFALKVKGDSMIEEGIHDGDIVIVRKQATAETGQTVVATIDGEATVKKFHRKKNRIELHPANAAMQPIMVGVEQDFRILGVVTGLVRRY